MKDHELYRTFGDVLRLHYQRLYMVLEDIGLYPGQPHVLFILKNNDGLRQKDLSDILNISPATLTMMLKRLEKENLIYRQKDEIDHRISRVYISKEGIKIAEIARKTMEDLSNECFGNLTEEERINMDESLKKVRSNLQEILEVR